MARAAGPDAYAVSDAVRAVVIDEVRSGPGGPGLAAADRRRRASRWSGSRPAGLNPVDLAIASGRFYLPLPEPPCVAGVEAVGIVVASERFPVGTRVWSLGHDRALLRRSSSHPTTSWSSVPEERQASVAAAMGVAGLAGWMPVMSRGAIVPGERVLVLGASGIVGQVAVQTARAAGAGWIVAAARSDGGCRRALIAGADRPSCA